MAIKEVTLTNLDQHGGRLLSIPVPNGGLAVGQLMRFKDANTVQFGTIEEFEASALSDVTGTVTAIDGSTLVLENGLIVEKTDATITGVTDASWTVAVGDEVVLENGLITSLTKAGD